MNSARPYEVGADPARGIRTDDVSLASGASAVSWGAIFAGAAGAAALSLILMLLGAGLGFSSISPWSDRGASAATFGVVTILWLTLTQIAASGMGGYLAGRLRSRWQAVHTDEVYFRDTAHGFLAWSVATLVTAATLTSAIGAVLGTGIQSAASVAGGAAATVTAGAAAMVPTAAARAGGAGDDPDAGLGYFVDTMMRRDVAAAPAPAAEGSAAGSAEAARIVVNDLRAGAMPAEDSRYLGQIVSQRTGLAAADAEKRVTEVFAKVQARAKEAETQAREAADKARKASTYATLWLFISLLIGAFTASLCATLGGRRRDL
jgi:hypothetical protein